LVAETAAVWPLLAGWKPRRTAGARQRVQARSRWFRIP